MTKEEIFAAWVPDASVWSRWAKPVLFAHLDLTQSSFPVAEPVPEASWSPPPEERVVLVLDLPGAEGVLAGVALAAKGYRPVPLYNAVPMPSAEPIFEPLTGRAVAAVNVLPIMNALRNGAGLVLARNLPCDAPPVFLLDANRRGEGRKMQPDEFDNRSVCFTTDFPSANFLLAHGIQRVLLVQRTRGQPQSDLAHPLLRWQEAGLGLERIQFEFPRRPEPLVVRRPSWYGAMFQRALAAVGLRRADTGGFGAWVPDSSAGG